MKKLFILGLMIMMTTSAFATGNGQVGSMTFTNHGTAHPTTLADGVVLKGKQAEVLYDSLAVSESSSPGTNGTVKEKIVHLDGQMPSTQGILGCYRDTTTTETECYMGKIGN